MTEDMAAVVVERSLADHHGADITTFPTEEQAEALEALAASTELAPDDVTDRLDLESGRMWMEVVAAIRAEVATAYI